MVHARHVVCLRRDCQRGSSLGLARFPGFPTGSASCHLRKTGRSRSRPATRSNQSMQSNPPPSFLLLEIYWCQSNISSVIGWFYFKGRALTYLLFMFGRISRAVDIFEGRFWLVRNDSFVALSHHSACFEGLYDPEYLWSIPVFQLIWAILVFLVVS